MPRIRSRQVETESINPRMLKRGVVKRSHIDRFAVGRDQIAPGSIDVSRMAPQSIKEQHLHPDLLARLGRGGAAVETLTFHLPGPVVTAQSDPYRVRSGGVLTGVADLDTPSTTGPIVIGYYRNGTFVGSFEIPQGSTGSSSPIGATFAPADVMRAAVLDPGTGAVGLVAGGWLT